MKNFMDSDFLLQTETAKMLYHDAAETMPIFDYHNHLNPKAILDDEQMDNLTQVWLGRRPLQMACNARNGRSGGTDNRKRRRL